MRIKLSRPILVLLIFAVALLAGGGTLAQDGDERQGDSIIINFAEVNASGPRNQQTLDVFFTVVDNQNRVDTNAEPQDGLITTSEGAFPAQIEPATAPIYLVIALDISGSMGPAEESLRAAAIEAVRNAPDEAQIALVSFNAQITTVQNFTRDRNLVINAIGGVRPVSSSDPNAGTCLFDAAMHTIDLLDQSAGGAARRATLLFTDGRDEVLAGQGQPCSQATFEEVAQRARTIGQEVAFYTIGLRGGPAIDPITLENLANATGGLTRVGGQADLTALFQEIIEALSSQWRARATLCVSTAVNSVTLNVNLGRNEPAQPQARGIEIPVNCEPEPPTPTPAPLALTVDSVRYNADETVSFQIVRSGDGDIANYRVQFINNRTGTVALEQVIRAENVQLQNVTLDLGRDVAQDIEIIVIAEDQGQNRLAQSEERRFALPTLAPTNTPAPTATPIPVEISLVNLQYDQNADTLLLSLDVQQQEEIRELTVFVDSSTGINQLRISPEISSEISIPIQRALIPGEAYQIRIRAETANGDDVEEATRFEYNPVLTATPTLTLTPTLTPTSTPTATLPPVQVTVISLEYDPDDDVLILTLDLQRAEEIIDFEIQLVDSTTQRNVGSFAPQLSETITLPMSGIPPMQTYEVRFSGRTTAGERLISPASEFNYVPNITPTPTATPPPSAPFDITVDPATDDIVIALDPSGTPQGVEYEIIDTSSNLVVESQTFAAFPESNELRIGSQVLPVGSYQVFVYVLDENGERVSGSSVDINYTPPPTPTPTPGPTFIEEFRQSGEDNPILFVVIVLVFLVLVALIVWALRQSRKRDTRTWDDNLPDRTRVGEVEERASNSGMVGMGGPSPDETIVDDDADLTIVDDYEAGGNPVASLYILDSPDKNLVESSHPIYRSNFKIGRKQPGLDLNLDGDGRVSRHHATIEFDGLHFFIRDENSNNGVFLDGQRIQSMATIEIEDNVEIRIGQTKMRFDVEKTLV